MVAQLRGLKAIRSDAVERAVQAVPRHAFMPGVALEDAYAPEWAEVTKRDADGVALSSISAARIQAFMLEQAQIRPGMRVLEIGSGGYNAALIAELAGPAGEVTTIDIDPDVTERARRLLDLAGYVRVNVALGDGAGGEPGHAPYDRIVVTAETSDLAPAWADQLTPGGRLVVPLRLRGLTRSIAFEPHNGHLASREYELCGFVPMQGTAEDRERLLILHDGEGEQVGLRLDDGQQPDTVLLRAAFGQPPVEAWSGLKVGPGTPFDDLDLWLATVLPGYALLTSTRQARDRGLVASWSPLGISTLIDDGTFAYLTIRPLNTERTLFEFGARGHGPDAAAAADRMASLIRTWGEEHRADRATFRACPVGIPASQFPAGLTICKRHYRFTISWNSK